MTTYDNYKSEIDWLGDIPLHWNVRRIKDIFKAFGSGTTPNSSNETFYENGTIAWLNTTDLNNTYVTDTTVKVNTKALKETSLKVYPPNSLAIAMYGQGKTRGTVGLLKIPFTSNQASCIMYKPYRLNTRYILYWFIYKYTDIRSINIGATQPNMNQDFVKNIVLHLPPLEEQTAIANYLDAKTQAIDKKIDLLSRKAATYKDLRKSVINQTVCRGLDKNVTLKDSELGFETPLHWTIGRLKDLSKNMSSGATPLTNIPAYYENGVLNWVNTGDLNDGIINNCQHKISEVAIKAYPNLKVNKKGTLLIAMYGATICKIGLLNIEATTNQACCCINFKKNHFNKFVFYWFLANKYHILSLSVGGTQPNISQGIISKLLIAIPPLREQIAIANYLDEKTQKIDAILLNIQKQMDDLKELRKALINDVVTGKIKVADN